MLFSRNVDFASSRQFIFPEFTLTSLKYVKCIESLGEATTPEIIPRDVSIEWKAFSLGRDKRSIEPSDRTRRRLALGQNTPRRSSHLAEYRKRRCTDVAHWRKRPEEEGNQGRAKLPLHCPYYHHGRIPPRTNSSRETGARTPSPIRLVGWQLQRYKRSRNRVKCTATNGPWWVQMLMRAYVRDNDSGAGKPALTPRICTSFQSEKTVSGRYDLLLDGDLIRGWTCSEGGVELTGYECACGASELDASLE